MNKEKIIIIIIGFIVGLIGFYLYLKREWKIWEEEQKEDENENMPNQCRIFCQ